MTEWRALCWLAGMLVPQSAAAERLAPEQAFAELLLGRHYEDPCANTSGGALRCAPVFSDRRMDFTDAKARQIYRFGENRCVVQADTLTADGQRFAATFNLQNVLYVNPGRARQEGDLMEVELFLQGQAVIVTEGKAGNVLVFIHKYRAGPGGEIGHDVRDEAPDLRRQIRNYQLKYCGALG